MLTGVLFSYQMSEQYIPFEARQAKKKDKQRRDEIIAGAIIFLGAITLGVLLASNGYADNPFEQHQDTSITVEDTSANK